MTANISTNLPPIPQVTSNDSRPKQLETLQQRFARKRRNFRGHLNVYVVINFAIFLIYLITGLASGVLFPWFLFPAIGWGIGLGIHGLNYRDWRADHQQELEQTKQLAIVHTTTNLALLPTLHQNQAEPNHQESSWQSTLLRCRAEIGQLRAILTDIDSYILHQDLLAQLDQGLITLEQLVGSAERIEKILQKIIPGGDSVLERSIAELEQKIAHTGTERLREAHQANRALLIQRKTKVEALQTEQQRIVATMQGFLLAVENLQLDSARLKSDPLPTNGSPLLEPIAKLAQEIEILRQVEAELTE